jgi:hypothetical protein
LTRLSRTWLSLFLVWHLAAGVVGNARSTKAGQALADVVRPYEQLLGIYQRWGMFAPHPPRKTIWPEAVGYTAAGERVILPIAWTDPDGDGVRRTYDHTTLLDRNLIGGDHKRLRAGYIRWLCNQADADGRPISRVEIYSVRQGILGPRAARRGEPLPDEKREELGKMWCP